MNQYEGVNLFVLLLKLIYNIVIFLFKPLLIEMTPLFLLFAPYLIGAGVLSIILLIIAVILRIRFFKKQLRESSVFLEVIPSYITLQTQFSTEQLFTTLHSILEPYSWIDKTIGNKRPMSIELVSTKKEGIRYVIKTSSHNAKLIEKNIRSYLPTVEVHEINDYLPETEKDIDNTWQIIEFKLKKHFAIPLISQAQLDKHDPIAYITGHMTQLSEKDMVSMQLVLTPVYYDTHPGIKEELGLIRNATKLGQDITPYINRSTNLFKRALKAIIFFIPKLILFIVMIPFQIIYYFMTDDKRVDPLPFQVFELLADTDKTQKELSMEEQSFQQSVGTKVKSELYEASLRFLVIGDSDHEVNDRIRGLITSLAPFNHSYQWLQVKNNPVFSLFKKNVSIRRKFAEFAYLLFKHRFLSLTGNSIFSVTEVASLYHFPYSLTTKTEDIVKNRSPKLPAPLSVKNNQYFDVIFGKNTYGNEDTLIGLTDDDRSRHVYAIGQTGSGKTTVIFHMAYDDIQKGRGLALIDPHGDLAEDLLTCIPEERINDCIYFNPYDLKYPVGINLLELTPGLEDDELEQEKELVCESVISIFRRVFSKDENTDAHRIEYILRNAIYTAFTIKNATIFTIYELLNNPKYQKSVTRNLEDEHLRNFWKNEFGKAGNYQIVKMVSGVTAKVGRFLFSPTARRILEQPESTITFDEILDTGKILICNLAEGKLGEDTSQLLGTTIIAKIQQAAMRRIRTSYSQRKPFYLFIDEFQNFATPSFTKLLSGGRKFGLRITIAEQSTAQQNDRNIVNVILANTGTVICFRTASPIDEQLMLSQFEPYVKPGNIGNLPRFKFYIKLSAVEPEEPFSGETLPPVIEYDQQHIQQIITASRKNYAIEYKKKSESTKSPVKKTSNNKGKPELGDDLSTLTV